LPQGQSDEYIPDIHELEVLGPSLGPSQVLSSFPAYYNQMDYDDDWEDLPAHVLKVTRLYPEEETAVAVSLQLTRDELEEAPRRTKMPPLSEVEQPNFPEKVLDAEPDEALDDPVITDGMKSSDDYVSNAYLKLRKEKLLRPWDYIDQSDEKV
jgi:hypothetical protein